MSLSFSFLQWLEFWGSGVVCGLKGSRISILNFLAMAYERIKITRQKEKLPFFSSIHQFLHKTTRSKITKPRSHISRRPFTRRCNLLFILSVCKLNFWEPSLLKKQSTQLRPNLPPSLFALGTVVWLPFLLALNFAKPLNTLALFHILTLMRRFCSF